MNETDPRKRVATIVFNCNHTYCIGLHEACWSRSGRAGCTLKLFDNPDGINPSSFRSSFSEERNSGERKSTCVALKDVSPSRRPRFHDLTRQMSWRRVSTFARSTILKKKKKKNNNDDRKSLHNADTSYAIDTRVRSV